MSDKQLVLTYDTTLRDGTQGEGVSFSVTSKLRLAEKLDQFGIDYIEGGWPGSNPRDIAFFERAAEHSFHHARLVAFGSTRRANIDVEDDSQVQLLLQARTPAVAIFGKSWLLHVTEVLRTTEEENLAMIEDTVRYLVDNGREVIYDAEHFFDGYRANPDYAMATLDAASRGGASCLSLCDTNGGMMVDTLREVTAAVVARFPKVKIGVHCHNDSGLGVAVTLAGVSAGASLVQGTMNGYGERNGNANLTTVIANLALKMDYPMHCRKNLAKLRDLSLFAAEMANVRHDPKAPFVGASAFAHKGGVHADAANKVKHSYEHVPPESVGNRTRVLVSDMSGRASIMMKAREMGMSIDPKATDLKPFLDELKRLEYKGYEYEAADASFKLLLRYFLEGKPEYFETLSYRVIVEHRREGDSLLSEATVKVKVGDKVSHAVAEANGPVGALDYALRTALAPFYPELESVRLIDFKVRILDSQMAVDAITRVLIESTDGEEIWGTVGASDNIIDASWQALTDSMEYKLSLLAGGAKLST